MRTNKRWNWPGVLLLVTLAGAVVLVLVLSCVPPISKDALVHHLAVPKLYLKHGGMYEIPFMTFSYYPMNLELLYTLPLYFDNDIVPKFIHFAFALLTAWLIFGYLKRRTNRTYALFGTLFFLSIPIIIKLSITVYVDLGVIFFSFASLLLLVKWVESRFRLRCLILSGIMCGLAMGTKYNALVTLFVLTLFVPFLYSRFGKDRAPSFLRCAGQGVVFLVVALTVFSPWMIRNYQWKNNPIYPFYDHWFNSPEGFRAEAPPQESEEERPSGPFAFRKVIYGETGWDIALLPFRIFFQGKDGDPQYFDGKLNPFLLFFAVLAFYRIREDPAMVRREKKMMLLFAILFFAFAFLSFSLRIRYIAPIIPPLVILSVMGMKKTADQLRERIKGNGGQIGGILVTGMAVVALTYNGAYMVGQFREVKPFSYLRGHLSRDEYIAHYRPEYSAMQYINRHVPDDSLILFVYLGNRGYYCDRRYRFGENLLAQLIVASEGTEEILQGLREVGATHLLVYAPLFEKWMKETLTYKKQSFVYRFISKYTKVIFNQYGFILLYLSNDTS